MRHSVDSDQYPARALVEAMETIIRVSNQEEARLAQARRQAAEMSEVFEGRMRASIEGQPAPPASPNLDLQVQLRDMKKRASTGIHSMREREIAFLDAFQALMDLCANASTRETAMHIMEIMRRHRLIALRKDDQPTLSMPTGFAVIEERNLAPKEKKREMMKVVLEHHEARSSQLEARRAVQDWTIAESHALMEEALRLAKTLDKTA